MIVRNTRNLCKLMRYVWTRARPSRQHGETLTGISDNILSSVLNELVKSNLITKKIFNEIPLKVEYHITPSGSELTKVMHQLCSWGKQNIPYEVRILPGSMK